MSLRPPVSRRGQPPRSSAIESAAADWVTRVDAGLTPEEQQIFQDWLSGDPQHADEFDRLTEAWSVFDRVQERGAASVILDQLTARSHRRKARRLQAGVAAGLILAAGLFYFQWRSAPLEVRPAQSAQIAQVAVPDPVRKLPDGSIVELNAGAEIAVQYSASERHVKLIKGEAFFRVEKDKHRPFFVEANGVMVRAVGTAFAVQMQKAAVEVVVQEGAVDVGRTCEPGPAGEQQMSESVRVPAGKRVVMALIKLRPALPRTVQPVVAPEAPAGEEETAQPQAMNEEQMNARLAWRLPRIEFEGTTLAEAVGKMNRHNRMQLRLAGEGVGQIRYSGTFRSDNPDGFVRMLEQMDFQAERHGDTEVILRRAR